MLQFNSQRIEHEHAVSILTKHFFPFPRNIIEAKLYLPLQVKCDNNKDECFGYKLACIVIKTSRIQFINNLYKNININYLYY